MCDLPGLLRTVLRPDETTGPIVASMLDGLDIERVVEMVRTMSTPHRAYVVLAPAPRGVDVAVRVHRGDQAAPGASADEARWAVLRPDGSVWTRVVADDGSAVEHAPGGARVTWSLADRIETAPAIAKAAADHRAVALHTATTTSLHFPQQGEWERAFDRRELWCPGFASTQWSGYVGHRLVGVAARVVHHARVDTDAARAHPALGICLRAAA